MLAVLGPPSSGKTSVNALIVRKLQEIGGRTYVAHHFFPSQGKKAGEEADKSPLQTALKHLIFQLACADPTLQGAVSAHCNEVVTDLRSPGGLQTAWTRLDIGSPGIKSAYYIVLDGLENLGKKHTVSLLEFLSRIRPERELTRRVRVLVVLPSERLLKEPSTPALSIRVDKCNESDIRIFIKNALDNERSLQDPGRTQQQKSTKDLIVNKLSQKVQGRYSLLQIGLKRVFRLLGQRPDEGTLRALLEDPVSNHEATIQRNAATTNTQRHPRTERTLKWLVASEVIQTI